MRAQRIIIAVVVAAASAGVARADSAASGDVPASVRAALGASTVVDASGHYHVTLPGGDVLTTHGPDPAPDPTADHGTSIGPGDPERDPICATDYYMHVLYGRPSGSADRLSSLRPRIISAIRRINAVLNEESQDSGGPTADYKILCESNGTIRIDTFTSTGNDFQAIATAAQAAGFIDTRADYSIFYDASGGNVCGVANISFDDSLSENNSNNTGRDYAVTYEPCWDGRTPMHENGHNQGAVQAAAPDSTGSGGHCNDVYDVMCYSPDGGDKNQGGTVLDCIDKMHFDCGHDTYFDSATEQGEWLATHWNLGSHLNRFIAFDGSGGGGSNVAPDVAFSVGCEQRTCAFLDQSSDPDGWIASRVWNFGDGTTSTGAAPTRTYAQTGAYDVRLTVTDDRGAISSMVRQVITPTIPVITQPAHNSTVPGPDVTVAGTGPPGATISIALDSQPHTTTVAGGSGAWSVNLALLGGDHSVVARSSSLAGTSPASDPRAFVVEDPPAVDPVVTSPRPGQVTWPTPTVAGNARGASRVQLRLDGTVVARIPVGSDGDFTEVISTTGGTHTLVVESEGSHGLIIGSSDPVTFTVDAIRPEIRVQEAAPLTVGPFTTGGTARDDRILTRVVATATNQATGARAAPVVATLDERQADGWTPWTATFTGLLPGRYVIEVYAEDHVGLRSLKASTATIIV